MRHEIQQVVNRLVEQDISPADRDTSSQTDQILSRVAQLLSTADFTETRLFCKYRGSASNEAPGLLHVLDSDLADKVCRYIESIQNEELGFQVWDKINRLVEETFAKWLVDYYQGGSRIQ